MKNVLSYRVIKGIILVLCIGCMQLAVTAQPPGDGNRLKLIIIGYITRQLELSETEAQKFWPIYNEYEKEMKVARRSNKTDELAKEEAMLKIRKSYKVKFTSVGISDEKVNKLFKIEKEIVSKMEEAMQKRKAQHGGGGKRTRMNN